MNKLVIASTKKCAGKTSIAVGLAKASGKKFGYVKPFGDRMLYRKKRLWDYDAALMSRVFGLDEDAEEISIGFEHSKLRYMYDEESTKSKLCEMIEMTGNGKDAVIIEAGGDLSYGASVYLDAISVAKNTGAKLLVVINGNDGDAVDEATFLKKYVNLSGVDFAGVIINNVHDVEDFKQTYLGKIKGLGMEVLGVLPYAHELGHNTAEYISDRLFAKVLAGEAGLKNVINTVFVGAMSASEAMRSPIFKKEGKLIITSGDRSDMILAALETNAAAIVLTNNILPPSNIISKAAEANVPLLLVPGDTFATAKKVDDMEMLLTHEDDAKIALLEKMVKENVDYGRII
ncbi:MAG: hypothetical protein CVT48_04040 [Thermoplasmata archaeon HGW-Thermoplasmata-1]|nr:MAG: hypothetical protein CVT48_04040 [Thermoplasmata archaeon HGW-Thermoplasmata-1]